jgi:integrase
MPKIPQVHFRLNIPNDKGLCNIILDFTYHNRRLRYKFGQSVEKKDWNEKKERVKSTQVTTSDGKFSLNDMLDKLEYTCKKSYNESLKDGIPDPSILRKALDLQVGLNKGLNNEYESGKPTLFTLADKFIKGDIKNKGKEKSKGSLNNYHAVTQHLKGFRTYWKRSLDFNDIDLEFFYLYVSYLKNKLKLAENSIAKDISIIKVFMNEAVDLGYTQNLLFKHKKFSYNEVDTEHIYLSESELEKLYNLEITNNKLKEVRDLFIFGAWVGLRFSDFNNVKPENIVNIEGQDCIKMITQKTKESVIIPCHPVVKDIFSKYKDRPNKLPKSISNQKFNKYIKDVGKLAGFEEVGRNALKPKVKLHDLISSHTARRSFATNMYLKGFPTLDIMKITGHKTERSFLRYIRVDKLNTALRMSSMMKEKWGN